MKIYSKLLLLGALSLTLAACGGTNEDNNNVGTGGAANDNDNNEVNDAEENDNNTDDSAEVDGESDLPATILDGEDNELRVEFEGEEYTFDAESVSTEFGRDLMIVDGISLEYTDHEEPTAYALTDEEDHAMSALTLTLKESFLRDEVSEDFTVDVEGELETETFLLENAAHTESVEAHTLDESTPFDFYVVSEGDATGTGNFSDEIREAGEYRQYTFIELTGTERYRLVLQIPADADAELEAAALGMALSYQPGEESEEEAEENGEVAENNDSSENNDNNEDNDNNE